MICFKQGGVSRFSHFVYFIGKGPKKLRRDRNELLCAALMLGSFMFVACDDEDEAGCSKSDAEDCTSEFDSCIDGEEDMEALQQCTTDWCDCLSSSGCGDETGDLCE